MIDFIKQAITKLCDIMTVSGFEDTEESKLISLIAPMFDEYKRTKTNSFIFIKKSEKPNAKTVLLDAHLDEIGFMVTGVADNGFLKFSPVGGIDTRILPGADVTVYGNEKIRGVITSVAPHLMSEKEAKQNPKIEKLYIDTGYSSEWLKKNAGVGTPIGFCAPTTELLNNKLASHALDNKASIVTALAVMKMLENKDSGVNIVLLLSSREELGGPGAVTGAFEIMPDYAIVLDVNLAFLPENPGVDTDMYRKTVEIGEGVAVSVSAVTDRKLTRTLIRTAEECKIPYQPIVESSGTGTNADRLALVGAGIPTAVIGVPLGNMHTYSEVVSLDDILSTAKLIYNYILGGEQDE